MSTSSAAINVSNMQLTPMRVSFNGIDLGGTHGGVSFMPKLDYADIMADQYGKTVLTKIVSGYNLHVKFELVEIQKKDNWKVAFPSLKLITSGPTKGAYMDIQIGDGLFARAQQLILHPLDHADSDLTGDFLFYKAAAVATPTLKYTPSGQTVLAIEMVIFPDTSVAPARFWLHGDPASGLVAASAAAAVAGTNTGNGTVSAPTVSSGVTKTETITLLAVAPTKFQVTGSLSGALGVATTGVAFSSSVVGFTITAGTTAFVAGDSFTIATTAANYL